jgi:hypothetical protein
VPLWCLSLIPKPVTLSRNEELALCHGPIATVPVAWLQGTADLTSPHGGNPLGHALTCAVFVTEPFDQNERFQRSKDWISCASNTLHYLSYISIMTTPIFSNNSRVTYLWLSVDDHRRSSCSTPDKPKKGAAVVGLIEIVTTILLTR